MNNFLLWLLGILLYLYHKSEREGYDDDGNDIRNISPSLRSRVLFEIEEIVEIEWDIKLSDAAFYWHERAVT